jgi:organic radical activating enzyme
LTLKVCEIFFSVQGEGLNIGKPAVFVRLSGCNLRCPWCDSSFSWSEGKKMTVDEVLEEISKYPTAELVTITGGEPLLRKEELFELCFNLQGHYYIEVETNGTIEPGELSFYVTTWNISPKLSSANGPGTVVDFFKEYNKRFNFKFVIKAVEDLNEMEQFLKENNINEFNTRYLMPQCTLTEEMKTILPMLIEYAKKHSNFRVTPRLQILAYGNKRGT